LFFAIEALLRRSIPLRVREVAHVLGLLVIVTLGAIAFKNDVERRWDAIRGHFIEDSS
jgi:regulator of sigma E protease